MTSSERPQGGSTTIITVKTGQILRQKRIDAGLSQADFAKLMGCDQGDVSRRENAERRIDIEYLHQAAAVLQIDLRELLPGRQFDAPKLASRSATVSQEWPAQYLPDFIPVRVSLNRDVPAADWTPRPPALLNVTDGYAYYVSSTTMVPRFRPGQRLYINPHRPPSAGSGIVILTVNMEHILSQYAEDIEEMVHSDQLNPTRHLQTRRADIRALHTVIGLDEF